MTKKEIIKRFQRCQKRACQDIERINQVKFINLVNNTDSSQEISDYINETFYDLYTTAMSFRDLAEECEKIKELS